MNKPCARITLDLQQASTPTFVAVKKSDIGREIRITLSDGGFPYEISADCYAVLTGTKPDGNILYNHCDIEGNTIVYTVTEQTTAAAGRMKAEVKLYGADDQLVTSATFRIIIDGTVYTDDKVESSPEFSALNQLMNQVLEIIRNHSDESISVSIVTELPKEDISTSTLYLVKDTEKPSNIYTEYLYVNGEWEIIGSQQLDLTGYIKTINGEGPDQNGDFKMAEIEVKNVQKTVTSVGGTITNINGVSIEVTKQNPDGTLSMTSGTVWNGTDGVSPHIGFNGNWFVGDQDTGVSAGGNNSGGNAEDGFSPIAKVEQTATGAIVSITDKTGTTTATITNGKDGKDGADGQPGEKGDKGDPGEKGEQGIQGIPGEKGEKGETGAPGADGQPGKDGEDGKDGTAGKSAYEYAQEAGFVGTEEEFAQKLASEGSGGNVDESTVTKIVDEYLEKNPPAAGKDGLTPHIGDNGNWFLGETDSGVKAQGENGQRGRGILKITTEPSESGETVGEITAPYKVYRNKVMNDAGVTKDDILVGDIIMHASNLYKVLIVQGSFVYLDNPVNIQGEGGKTAYAYAQEAGFDGTEEEFAEKLANAGNGGGVSSWNDLTDKPFGNVVVTFDGNLDGKTAVSLYDGVYLVKVSDKVLSEAECVGANVAVSVYGYENTATAVGTQDLTSEYGISCFMPVFGDSSGVPYVVIVRESGTVMEQEVSSGTYFTYMEDDGLVYTKSCDALKQVKTIAPQYLPDYLPGIETIDPVFNGDLTGREKILADVNTGAYAVKVTPQSVSVDELIGATMVLNMGGAEKSMTLTAEMAMDSSFVLGVPGSVVLQGTGPIVLSLATNSIIQGASFSAGTWFMCIPGAFYVKSLSCFVTTENIRKLDERFLPDMTDSINALIDAKLGVIENGSY